MKFWIYSLLALWLGSVSAAEKSDSVSLFKLPEVLRTLRTEQIALEDSLDALPALSDPLQFDAYGYHGGYLSKRDILPENPRWTVDVSFLDFVKLDQVLLVPAVDHRFDRLGSYGFPKRFRVSQLFPDGHTTTIQEWLDEDCPDPGRVPLIMDLAQPSSNQIRIEVFRGASEGGKELFALDELFGVVDQRVFLGDKVAVSSEFKSLPYWSAAFLIDQQTSLGIPVGRAKKGAVGRDDFRVIFDSEADRECVVELDLGHNQKLGWLTFFPARPSEGIMIPGYGFPGHIAVEVITETKTGIRGPVKRFADVWQAGNPGNNIVRRGIPRNAGRWIRIIMSDLPVHNGRRTFAMGEINVSRKNRVYSIAQITLEGFPLSAVDEVGLLMDRQADGGPVMFFMEWLMQIKQRSEWLLVLDQQVKLQSALTDRWARFMTRTGRVVVLLILVAACLIAVIAVCLRRRALRILTERIKRDLHDEVGSSLGSISLTTERIRNSVTDAKLRDQLSNLALLAREANVSLREVVWVTGRGSVRLPDLLPKLVERAKRVLGTVDLSVELPPECPDRFVSLTAKRHLIMFFKEVVHNCVRHAQATRVQMRVETDDTQLRLCVSDNGCGFDPAQPSDGWGINNMRNRAQEMGGTMELDTCPGAGTSITLTLPLVALAHEPNKAYKASN